MILILIRRELADTARGRTNKQIKKGRKEEKVGGEVGMKEARISRGRGRDKGTWDKKGRGRNKAGCGDNVRSEEMK